MTKRTAPRQRSRATFLAFWTFYVLSKRYVTCIAVNDSPTKPIRVISTKRDGGLTETFTFGDPAVELTTASHKANADRKDHNSKTFILQIQAALRSTFLPSGYPTRTPPGYLSFSVWSWVQDLSTQLRSVLATQRVLEGIGVGREGATALSALMNFLVRDGCGMAATLVFTSFASSRFKSDVKRWRLFADIMVDVGITLEATATLVPQSFFLPMISVGNMCKAICGVAAGACGGAINLHWAKGSDISDINAKFGAQHTVTGSLGLVSAALFAQSVSTINQAKLWFLYSVLTLLHIVANMRCMKLIAFDSFNNARMKLVAAEFLEWWHRKGDGEVMKPTLSSPYKIARIEPLFFMGWRTPKLARYPIRLGESFNFLVKHSNRPLSELQRLLLDTATSNYVIEAGRTPNGRIRILVAFRSHAGGTDQAQAYFHAILLGHKLKQLDFRDEQTIADAERNVQDELALAWDAFSQSCKSSGWDLGKTELRTRGFELEIVTTE